MTAPSAGNRVVQEIPAGHPAKAPHENGHERRTEHRLPVRQQDHAATCIIGNAKVPGHLVDISKNGFRFLATKQMPPPPPDKKAHFIIHVRNINESSTTDVKVEGRITNMAKHGGGDTFGVHIEAFADMATQRLYQAYLTTLMRKRQSDVDIQTIDPREVTIAEKGAAIGAEQQFVCLLGDGRLLVADSYTSDPLVLSYLARVRRMSVRYELVAVDISIVKAVYENATRSKTQGSSVVSVSDMERHAMDMIKDAHKRHASDIHLRNSPNSMDIFYRIHGDMVRVGGRPKEWGDQLKTALYNCVADTQDSAFKPSERQDARIANPARLPDGLHGVRIATAPTIYGPLMVMRLLYNDTGAVNSIIDLGYTETHASILETMREGSRGMILFCGPTGSGKSTTQMHLLTEKIEHSKGTKHVLTVEDPPEYPIPGAVQTPITDASGEEERSRAFAAAISNAMRLDPDVIMIGEMRDFASATMGIRAAMTGHQVWTTLHANTAYGAIDRLVDLGVNVNLFADHDVLRAIVCQRLIKTMCPHCKLRLIEHRDRIPAKMLQRVMQIAGRDIDRIYVTGDGCDHCVKGVKGRTAVAEIIHTDPTFFEFVRAGQRTQALAYWQKEQLGQTLLQHAIEKMCDGLVDPAVIEDSVEMLNMGRNLVDNRLTVAEITGAAQGEVYDRH